MVFEFVWLVSDFTKFSKVIGKNSQNENLSKIHNGHVATEDFILFIKSEVQGESYIKVATSRMIMYIITKMFFKAVKCFGNL